MSVSTSSEKSQSEGAGPSAAPQGFPCSLAQQRFWFLEQIDPGNPALNVAVRWRMNGSISDVAVERAMQALIDRHEILRTRFVGLDGEPRQVVQAKATAKVTLVDLSRLKGDTRNAELEAISVTEARRPFDLEGGLPIRLAMLRLDEASIVVLLTMHHIATDGWTMGMLAHEFGRLVAEAMGGAPASLPPLDMQYVDYALWQSDVMQCDAFAEDERYWAETLRDLPQFEVTPDKPRPPVLSAAGDFRLRNIGAAVMEPVEALARRQGQTMYSLAATALALALAAETGRRDVVMGTQVAGRDDLLLEPVAGLFINTLVLHFDLQGAQSPRDANGICRKAIEGALAHQRFPFEKLVEMLNPPRDPSRTPLYSVNFTLIRPVIASERFGDIDLVSMPSQMTGAQYDLLFFMVKRDDGWRIVCESSASLYDTSTPDRILARWEDALKLLLDGLEANDADGATLMRNFGLAQSAADAVPPVRRPEPLSGDSATDTAITALWRELLQRDDIDLNSHFFDSGGHSLLALRMLARVRQIVGRPVSVAVLFQRPVLADFLAAIRNDATSIVDDEIAVLQPLGHKPPVIVLNNGAVFQAVARHIGTERPFIDLHLARGGGSFERHFDSLEDYAAKAVALIRRAQPKGPYTLVGHCILGTVAFEAAQQLRRAGETVSMVVLLDVLAPGYVEDMPFHDRTIRRVQMLGWSWTWFMQLVERVWSGRMTFSHAVFQYGFVRRSGLLRAMQKLGIVEADPPSPEVFSEVVFGNQLADVSRIYRLKPFAGDVMQFRASTMREGRLFDRGFGWERWIAGQYDVVEVPGDHFNMMRDPAAGIIGASIARRLDEIEAKARRR